MRELGFRGVIAIAVVGLTALGCASRTFEDDEFGESADEVGSSSSSSSTTTTVGTFETTNDWEDQPADEPTPDADWETSSDDFTTESSSEESTDEFTDEPTTGGGLPNGASCTSDNECSSNNCYVVPFLGGQCGECNGDDDCIGGGCTPPNPFEANGSFCNMGELGGGCESTDVCMPGLVCGNVLDLLGLIQINTCGTCDEDSDCVNGEICAPLVDLQEWTGVNDCITPGTVPQDGFCNLGSNGDQACASGVCSTIDIMGLAEIGACGECNFDADCGGGTCVTGEFILDTGTLVGSTCQ